MKNVLIVVFVLLLAVPAAAQDWQARLKSQLKNSCAEPFEYVKTVRSMNDGAVTDKETQTFAVSKRDTACFCEGLDHPFLREFQYATSLYYKSPRLEEYFDVQNSDGAILAKRKPEVDKTELVEQVIAYSGDQISTWKSVIRKESWLYETDIAIEVFFDENGNYRSHQIEFKSSVALIGETFHTIIEGKRANPQP